MDMNRETPLHVAVRANHPRLVEILLDFGAHPDISGIFLPHGKETELTGENP
jgi:ankyrin repeat protein